MCYRLDAGDTRELRGDTIGLDAQRLIGKDMLVPIDSLDCVEELIKIGDKGLLMNDDGDPGCNSGPDIAVIDATSISLDITTADMMIEWFVSQIFEFL